MGWVGFRSGWTAICCVWIARLAFAQQGEDDGGILHVTSSYSATPDDPTLSTEGVFQLHIPAGLEANWTASKSRSQKSRGEEDDLINLDRDDLGDAASLNLREDPRLKCSDISLGRYVEGTLNPSYDKVQNARKALKENGFQVDFDLSTRKTTITTTHTIAKGQKANYSHAERLRALFDWSSELQQIAAKQMIQYLKDCPAAKSLELGQSLLEAELTQANSQASNETNPTPPPTSDDSHSLGYPWDGHFRQTASKRSVPRKADPPKFPNRRRRKERELGQAAVPQAASWAKQFPLLPRGEPANSNRFAGMTPEQVSDLVKLGKDLQDPEALKRTEEGRACVKGECNNQSTSSNTSVLSGLNPQDIANPRFNQSTGAVELAWCGKMKCGCDLPALDSIKNRSILRAPDSQCQCWVSAAYTKLDASSFKVTVDILDSEPVKSGDVSNQSSSNPEAQKAVEDLESELATPMEVQYECGPQAQLQCLDTARSSVGELHGWFLDWRRGKCLEGPNEDGTQEDDKFPTETGQDETDGPDPNP